jgi:hypothetical protein
VLPDWPAGTVTILSTSGTEPHAIPISSAVRAGPSRLLIAILSGDDVALTAYGAARVIDERIIDGVVAVEIEVDRVQNHRRDTFVIDAGVRWRWTDPAAQQRDSEVRTALTRLAQR